MHRCAPHVPSNSTARLILDMRNDYEEGAPEWAGALMLPSVSWGTDAESFL